MQTPPDGFLEQIREVTALVSEAADKHDLLIAAAEEVESLRRAARDADVPGEVEGALHDARRSLLDPARGEAEARKYLRRAIAVLERGPKERRRSF